MRTLTKMTATVSVAALLGLGSIATARADTFNFTDFDNIISGQSVQGPDTTLQPGANVSSGTAGNLDQFFSQTPQGQAELVGGTILKVEAFQTTGKSFSTTKGINNSGTSVNLSTAFLGDYTNTSGTQQFGLGVTDSSEGSGAPPAHTVSNQAGKTDVVAFLLPSGQLPSSILINQFCSTGSRATDGKTCAQSSQGTGSSNINVFLGTAASLSAINGTSLSGFIQLTDSNLASGSPTLEGTTTRTITFDQSTFNCPGCNVLIVTTKLADLGTTKDYFKVGALTTTVPEPGTLSMLGVGLAGIACWRRRQRTA